MEKMNSELFEIPNFVDERGLLGIIESKLINFEVKRIIGKDVVIKKFSSNDNRSYHISSEKILKNLFIFI
jgi:hypothetical protein